MVVAVGTTITDRPRTDPYVPFTHTASMRGLFLSTGISASAFGGSRKGACPLAGGAAVFAAWGEPARPGVPLWGNGKGE